MPVDIAALVQPATTAFITTECQRGVIGPLGPLPALLEAIQASGFVPRAAAVLDAARRSGAPVLHGVVHRRPDGGGVTYNCRLLSAAREVTAKTLLAGSEGAEVIDEFGPGENDYIVPRYHGVSLFHDTELDALLRSLQVRTVVFLGASLNVAVMGSTIEAVNRGYQVVLPADGIVGTPPEYAEMMLQHSMKVLATVTDCATIIDALGGDSK